MSRDEPAGRAPPPDGTGPESPAAWGSPAGARPSMALHPAWFEAALDSGPVAFALADEGGLLVVVNDALCVLLGRPREELLGLGLQDFAHPDDVRTRRTLEDLLTAAGSIGETLQLEQRFVRPDGTVRQAWVNSAHTVGPGGRRWMMAVVHDTTAEPAIVST